MHKRIVRYMVLVRLARLFAIDDCVYREDHVRNVTPNMPPNECPPLSILIYATQNMMKPTLIHEQIPDIITFLTHVNMIRKFAHSKAIAVLKWNEHYVRHPQPDIVTLTKDDCLLLESLAIDSDDAQQMFRQIVNDLSRLVCPSVHRHSVD